MDYKVLFLDIDGTILMPDHTYSASTKDAILQVKEQGIEVFIDIGSTAPLWLPVTEIVKSAAAFLPASSLITCLITVSFAATSLFVIVQVFDLPAAP